MEWVCWKPFAIAEKSGGGGSTVLPPTPVNPNWSLKATLHKALERWPLRWAATRSFELFYVCFQITGFQRRPRKQSSCWSTPEAIWGEAILGPVQLWVITIHSTQYLFSDLLKVYSEFSKSAPGTSSSCRLYNNHVEDTQDKVTGNHVMYDCGAWFLLKANHVKFGRFVLLAVSAWRSKNMTSRFASLTE